MINYSFIIPHKNVAKLLERCILSIPYRDDVEIIVVDDNSEDKDSLQALECLRHSNVQIVCLDESRGAGFARNKGIELAKGKWLLFADADDFYTENISAILDNYVADDITDVVYLNAQAIDENGVVFPLLMGRYIENYKKARFYSEKVLRFANWVPWTRMVKREMVEKYHIRYEEIPVGNDAMFSLMCSKYAVAIVAESNVMYNYYKPSAGSCTYHCYKTANLASMMDLRFRMNKLYAEVGFVFRQTLLVPYIAKKSYRNDEEYKHICNESLKKNGYSLIRDLINTFVYYFGKLLRII